MLKNIFTKKPVKIIMILVILGAVGTGSFFVYRNTRAAAASSTTSKDLAVQVQLGELQVTISGSGTVQPSERYDIVPLVKGNILEAPFEEGANIKAGALLYKIDDSDLSYTILKTQNSIKKLGLNSQQTNDTLNNLTVYATVDGRIINFDLTEGAQVGGSNTRIASIVNDKVVFAEVTFDQSQLKKIKVGQKATITLPKFMSSVDGIVSEIANTTVKISINNEDGNLTQGTEVSAIIINGDEEITSENIGKLAASKETQVVSQASGKIKKLYVKNNDWVKAGEKILTLENSDILVTKEKNALDMNEMQLTLDSQKKQLKDYNIVSPIDGIIMKKYFKAGDSINNNGANTILATVADFSKMKFTIDVDELDIAKITKGQKVVVTADALADDEFEGQITNIPMEGTSQNGVTSYPVEVTISAPGSLKSGMNVNAKIVVESKSDALYVPVAAVRLRSGKISVILDVNGEKKLKQVQTGMTTDQYIEITEGLSENDTIYITMVTTTNRQQTGNSNFQGLGGIMGGGIPGGGGNFIRQGGNGTSRTKGDNNNKN